jgi:D-beta-D-heptose 7-phosphate kinase / D-beta-D-heptose 1-phosphate adenosyltransferase
VLIIARMNDRASLTRHIDPMARAKLLCVGDVMLDHFIYGSVERISPEAPIPVLKVSREARMLGGAGNVARNATALGASVSLVGVVGDDGAGRDIERLVAGEVGIDPNLAVVPARATTVKTRYVAHGQQLLRADREDAVPLTGEQAVRVMQLVDGEIASADIVVISDYAKGVLTPDVVTHIVKSARAAGKPVIADTKSTDLSAYRGISLLTPNARELGVATQALAVSDGDVDAAAQRLAAAFDFGAIVVTRSERGMSVVLRGKGAVHLGAEAREVFDVSGAGDTVLAVLALALAAGAPITEAAMLANAAAGIVVAKAGTAVVHADELARALRSTEMKSAQDKILSSDGAADRAAGWRAKGLKVGFTNGCFDLLHPGHVALVTQARAQCDRLIVGLNTDASVRQLKGEGRPVNSEMARAVVLAALETVDAVVLFGEDTPIKLIEAVKPDVLVKGADYTIDRVVGADFVKAQGGRVVLVELVPGQSTTGVIERMDPSKAPKR